MKQTKLLITGPKADIKRLILSAMEMGLEVTISTSVTTTTTNHLKKVPIRRKWGFRKEAVFRTRNGKEVLHPTETAKRLGYKSIDDLRKKVWPRNSLEYAVKASYARADK